MAGAIINRVHARVGLLGNPSDGFFGKTIAFSLANFYAEVTLTPSDTISFTSHPIHDRQEFDSLEALTTRISGEGYYGGIRLLMATCKRFYEYCQQHSIQLEKKNFTLSYDINIPRQTGLSGSSAIVCAALNCLMEYFNVAGHIPVEERPTLVLSAEQELGITAGLQDRVIQVYGGLVYMDFDETHMKAYGRGKYQPLSPSLLPPLWVMYADNPSESGKVHSDVKKRWLEGDEAVREGMKAVASCAEQGRQALEQGNMDKFATLMSKNFDLRRSMFGDAVLGTTNLQMVELARSVGAAAKFTGSGGAVVVLCPKGEEQAHQLQGVCEAEGFTLVEAQVGAPAVAG